jgi:Tfp pilus assembly protein PilN
MIKINLLPQKRAKRAATSEPGSRDIVIGVAALAGIAAVVFFAVDQPKRAELAKLREANDQLQKQINDKSKELAGPPSFAELDKINADVNERALAISRLMNAKVVPANMLHELGEILAANHLPTMTEEMARLTGNGPRSDANKRFDLTWDPTHVWLLSFVDDNGTFTLEGGAQSEVDVTQLAKRLAASVYFSQVAPSREERIADKDSGINYYHFTITGKVAY